MKFFIFGDEERFLLDRMKELNRNFDKETRIKLLRSEVKKREKILRKRWRKHRYAVNHLFMDGTGVVNFYFQNSDPEKRRRIKQMKKTK